MVGEYRNITILCLSIVVFICNAAYITHNHRRHNFRDELNRLLSSANSRTNGGNIKLTRRKIIPILVRRGAHFWYSPQGFLGTQTSGESGEKVVDHFESIINDTVDNAELFVGDLKMKLLQVTSIMEDTNLQPPKNLAQALDSMKEFVNEKYFDAVEYIRNANTSCYRIACSIATCYLTQADWCILNNGTVPEDIQAINKSLVENSQKEMKSKILRVRLPLDLN